MDGGNLVEAMTACGPPLERRAFPEGGDWVARSISLFAQGRATSQVRAGTKNQFLLGPLSPP